MSRIPIPASPSLNPPQAPSPAMSQRPPSRRPESVYSASGSSFVSASTVPSTPPAGGPGDNLAETRKRQGRRDEVRLLSLLLAHGTAGQGEQERATLEGLGVLQRRGEVKRARASRGVSARGGPHRRRLGARCRGQERRRTRASLAAVHSRVQSHPQKELSLTLSPSSLRRPSARRSSRSCRASARPRSARASRASSSSRTRRRRARLARSRAPCRPCARSPPSRSRTA